MTITFRHVDPAEAETAFHWHREFAAGNEHIFPRTWDHYHRLARDWQIWCAVEDGTLVGLVYYTFDDGEEAWELGGLMVTDSLKASTCSAWRRVHAGRCGSGKR